MVVDEGNGLVMLLDPIDGHPCPTFSRAYLQDCDVVDRFAKPIMHRESLPVLRKTWGKA